MTQTGDRCVFILCVQVFGEDGGTGQDPETGAHVGSQADGGHNVVLDILEIQT